MPLKGVSFLVSPDLLHTLCSMGHGDEIVLADAHFPSSSICKNGNAKELRADGHNIPDLLEAILDLIPLDTYVSHPVALMEMVPDDKKSGLTVPVWDKYKEIAKKAEGKEIRFEMVERFAFYDRAKKAFAVLHTGEVSKYGNIIVKKGIVMSSHQAN